MTLLEAYGGRLAVEALTLSATFSAGVGYTECVYVCSKAVSLGHIGVKLRELKHTFNQAMPGIKQDCA